jgi:hypothetical protein
VRALGHSADASSGAAGIPDTSIRAAYAAGWPASRTRWQAPLSPPSQLALTLRAVGGLTTAEIAAAFLAPEATIAKRITRAKQRIRQAGARFELPHEPERTERLGVVLHVLYLLFNEGYTASSGPALLRADLTAEAIRSPCCCAACCRARGRPPGCTTRRRRRRRPTGRRSSRSTTSSPWRHPGRRSRLACYDLEGRGRWWCRRADEPDETPE